MDEGAVAALAEELSCSVADWWWEVVGEWLYDGSQRLLEGFHACCDCCDCGSSSLVTRSV